MSATGVVLESQYLRKHLRCLKEGSAVTVYFTVDVPDFRQPMLVTVQIDEASLFYAFDGREGAEGAYLECIRSSPQEWDRILETHPGCTQTGRIGSKASQWFIDSEFSDN